MGRFRYWAFKTDYWVLKNTVVNVTEKGQQDSSYPNRGPRSLNDGVQMGLMLSSSTRARWVAKLACLPDISTEITQNSKFLDLGEGLMVQKCHRWEIGDGYGSFSDGCILYQKRYASIKMGFCEVYKRAKDSILNPFWSHENCRDDRIWGIQLKFVPFISKWVSFNQNGSLIIIRGFNPEPI